MPRGFDFEQGILDFGLQDPLYFFFSSALLSLLGCTAAFIADQQGSIAAFIVVVALAGVLVMIAYSLAAREDSMGVTTEVEALITMAIRVSTSQALPRALLM